MIKKYGRKTVNLSQTFYVPEYPKHLSDGNGFNPPRCNKCQVINYWSDDTCKECFESDEAIQEIKENLECSINDFKAEVEDLKNTLEELCSLKCRYLFYGTSTIDKKKILQDILEQIPD
jgi:hypothetical protein